MSTAFLPVERIQDLIDGPGELGPREDGQALVWSWEDRRFITLAMPSGERTERVIVRAGGGGTTDHAALTNLDYASSGHTGFAEAGHTHDLADAGDFTDTTGAGTDGYAIIWDNGTSKFILSDVTTSPGGGNTHVQYNSSGSFAGDSGFTYAGGGVATLTGQLVVPIIRPSADSATAVRIQNAAGSSDVVTVDTAGSRVTLAAVVLIHGPGTRNTFVGASSGVSTSGANNSGFGADALAANVDGYQNSAVGAKTLSANTSGYNNSALGYNSLLNNTTGHSNSAVGANALRSNTTGYHNAASGLSALFNNTDGYQNNAMGMNALLNNTTGNNNSGVGYGALLSNTSGANNIGVGTNALRGNTTGAQNVGIGSQAGFSNSTGSNNIFIGYQAGFSETGSNKLYIAPTSTANPLIFGDFSTGQIGISNGTPTAVLDLPASTTSRSSLRIRSGTAPTSPNDGDVWKNTDEFVMFASGSNTNTVLNVLRLRRNTSGTPAAGYGSALNFQLKSSTTAGRDAGRLTYEWVTATDASRASRVKLTAYSTTTEQEAIRIDGDSGGVKLGFYAATAVAKQSVTGSRGGNAALADLLTKLANLGLITDGTSA